MRKSARWLVVAVVAALMVRCDCGGEDPPPSGSRSSGEIHAGVGDLCYGDSVEPSVGCGYNDGPSTTCAQGLLCCKNPSSTARPYVCVASRRCGTSQPGEYCADDRDCQSAYTCVGHVCATAVGVFCDSDLECITRHCIDRRCGYLEPDLGRTADLPWDLRRRTDLFRREARVRDQRPEARPGGDL